MPVFEPLDIIGRSFLLDEKGDGTRQRAHILRAIDDFDNKLAKDPSRMEFICHIGDDDLEEIMTYADIINHIQHDESTDILWKFKAVLNHQGPLTSRDKNYKGSRYNVLVDWETGEKTWEPLDVIAKADPVCCALYAKDKGLLSEVGWKRFRQIAKRQKKLIRMVNQAKRQSYRKATKYMYGYEVPKSHEDAMRLDALHGNHKWRDATNLEMHQLDEYETFIDKGHKDKVKRPHGHKSIRVHLVHAIKHDGRHKVRCVAGGHLTDVPDESVYSGVVSIRGLRIITFLAELNDLCTWTTDIGNAYLESKTKEKVYIIAGPEFGDRENHILVINKALYGLRTSGKRWSEKCADSMRDMGFTPCKMEPEIWMRRNGDIYEYIAIYVDDLAIAAKNPQEIIDHLEKQCKYKLKGTGEIHFHLGCDYFRDKDGTLCYAPKKYIEKMIGTYEKLFGSKPNHKVTSPLEKGDHPEIDTSDYLGDNEIKIYQSLIGALQWAVTLGRMDITTAVMSMSAFRAEPRVGHLDRVKRMYSYLSKFKNATIRIRTGEPDYSDLPDPDYDWTNSVYGDFQEEIPDDVPTPLGKWVTLSHYVDANLFHCLLTGRSVTGILHFLNKTPVDWFSKKQNTVETATYGSEFVAARICTEQVIDLRLTMWYLGVPIRGKSYMFGDNKSVVTSSSVPHSKLQKRHVALSYHRVRAAISAGILEFHFIDGVDNPADICSKHWGYQ